MLRCRHGSIHQDRDICWCHDRRWCRCGGWHGSGQRCLCQEAGKEAGSCGCCRSICLHSMMGRSSIPPSHISICCVKRCLKNCLLMLFVSHILPEVLLQIACTGRGLRCTVAMALGFGAEAGGGIRSWKMGTQRPPIGWKPAAQVSHNAPAYLHTAHISTAGNHVFRSPF